MRKTTKLGGSSYPLFRITSFLSLITLFLSLNYFAYATPVVPDAPTSIVIIPGNTVLMVNFLQGSDGGSAITDYKYSTDGGATFTSSGVTASPIVIMGLTNGTSYNIQIEATNTVGDSAPSATVVGTPLAPPPATIPDVSTSVVITPGDTTLSVAFTAGFDGGSPITDYKYSTDGGTTFTSSGVTASPIIITGLTNGTSYNVQIEAVNAIGDGTPTGTVIGTPVAPPPPATVPDISTSVVITPGDTTLSVAFTTGLDGGSPITDYKYSTDGGATFTSSGVTASPIVIPGLINGTAYNVQIKAVNAIGDGTPTGTVVGTPIAPATVPNTPTSVLITPGDTTLLVAFSLAPDGGSPITGYKYSTDGGITFISSEALTSPITITGLTNGTAYSVQIEAFSLIGTSIPTSTVIGTPVAPTPTPTPTPTPAPIPAPTQQSNIFSINPVIGTTESSIMITLSGKFIEKVSAIQVNNISIATWTQSPSLITFIMPSMKIGTYSIQLFNGSFPLLREQQFSFVAQAPMPTPTPTPTPITCDTGFILSQGTCITDPNLVPVVVLCATGTSLVGNVCIPDTMPSSSPSPNPSPSSSPTPTPTPTPTPSPARTNIPFSCAVGFVLVGENKCLNISNTSSQPSESSPTPTPSPSPSSSPSPSPSSSPSPILVSIHISIPSSTSENRLTNKFTLDITAPKINRLRISINEVSAG